MPSDPVTAALDALSDANTSSSRVLVAATVAERGSCTVDDLRSILPIGRNTVYEYTADLTDAGVLDATRQPRSGRGSGPRVFEPGPELRTALAADERELSHTEIEDTVIAELARIHYQLGVSGAKIKRLRGAIDGASTHDLARAMDRLVERGVVERVEHTSSGIHWRLVGADAVASYYGDTAQTEVAD